MTRTRQHGPVGARGAWLLAGAFLLIAPACTGIEPCKKKGVTEACACGGGGTGTRTCLPELVWDHCECGSLPPADAGVSGTHGGGGGAGAISGGGGTSGSTAPAGSGGAGGSGGSAPTGGDEDGGVDMMGGSGAGSGGAAGAAGMGGTGGSSGSSGTGGTAAGSAYGACTGASANECGAGATCESAQDPDDLSAMVHRCAPACSDVGACPAKPAGSYTAALVCADGRCMLDCTPPLLEPDLTCPSGMRCAAGDLLGPSFCY